MIHAMCNAGKDGADMITVEASHRVLSTLFHRINASKGKEQESS